MTTRGLPIRDRLALGAEIAGKDDCWVWKKSVSRSGYGQINHLGKSVQAHRLSYELNCGSIPDGMFVCHRCDNRRCINPAHLFVGTALDNNRDRDDKGRSAGGRLIGEDNPLALISNETAIAISRTSGPLQDVSAKFGVAPGTVSAIRTGRAWGHVTGVAFKPFLGRDGLTDRQREILSYLVGRLSYQPTRFELSELSTAFGWRSHVTSLRIMRKLRDAGFIAQTKRSHWVLTRNLQDEQAAA